MGEDEKKRREDLYAETRKDLLTRQLSNSEKFDGAILTLSTAALGVSLTFIKDIVPLSKVQCVCLLKISWWLFGIAILSTVISFIVSQLAIAIQLRYAEEYYLNNKNEFLTKINIPAKITDLLNYSSAFFFIAALICTIVFVSTNLRGESVMPDEKSSNQATAPLIKDNGSSEASVPITRAAPIPTMQPIQSGDTEKKGAPIPNMQPVPNESQTETGEATNSESSQDAENDKGQGKK